jgi:hypothetical protein
MTEFEGDMPTHLVTNARLMGLLSELLASDKRELVTAMLKVCVQKCDDNKQEQLADWYKQVKSGESPKLGWPAG